MVDTCCILHQKRNNIVVLDRVGVIKEVLSELHLYKATSITIVRNGIT